MKVKEIFLKNKFFLIKFKLGDGILFMVMKLFYDFIDKYDWMILFCIFEVIDFDEVIGENNFVILIDGLFDLDSVFFEYKKEWVEKF